MATNGYFDKKPVPVQLPNLTLSNQEPISGSFGHVYRVTDQQGDTFAVKICLTPSARQIQASEVEVSQKLMLIKDCNLVSVFDMYREDISYHGFLYTAIKFKMEYVNGGSISENLIRLGRKFNLAEAKFAGYQIAKGVHSLHLNRILHRDLTQKRSHDGKFTFYTL